MRRRATTMANNPKKRKKVSFGQRRYPMISKTETEKRMLPDKVFWPAYYGRYRGGIYDQLMPRLRWHVIECLEDGFQDDDMGLLRERQGLIGLEKMCEAFCEKHQVVLDSPTFQEKVEWMEMQREARWPRPHLSKSKWEERAERADREFKWYLSYRMEWFYKVMEFSSPYHRERIAWDGLMQGYLDFAQEWSPRHQGQLEGLDFNAALALVDEWEKSEISELYALKRGLNKQKLSELLRESKAIALGRLARERYAYIQKLAYDEVEREKKEHTNFGLDIDVPSLPDRMKKYT
jgi:hypothetical protein